MRLSIAHDQQAHAFPQSSSHGDKLRNSNMSNRVFSRTTFRPERFIAITGAVRSPGRILFREGMTLRDAILESDGLTEDALLETTVGVDEARASQNGLRVGGHAADQEA